MPRTMIPEVTTGLLGTLGLGSNCSDNWGSFNSATELGTATFRSYLVLPCNVSSGRRRTKPLYLLLFGRGRLCQADVRCHRPEAARWAVETPAARVVAS